MDIEHISISRESTYKECNQKYKFKYHLKVLSPVEEPIYFAYGKLVHRAIEEYTKCHGNVNINDIGKDLLEGRMEIQHGMKPPKLPLEYRRKLPVHLNNFIKLSQKIGTKGELEYKFHYDLDPPHKRYCTGFIDRLIRNENSAMLIDYKTTKAGPWRKDWYNITTDLQLQCYCWVVMKEFGIEPQNIKAALYYLEDATIVPVRFSKATLEAVPERLLRIYKDIESHNPDQVKGNVGNWCERCDYKSMCPYYKPFKK